MSSQTAFPEQLPRLLLARADTVLPHRSHELLASSAARHVRYRWAARGDIPEDVLVSTARTESSESVRLLLETHPGFPRRLRSSQGPWRDAVVALDRASSEAEAALALARLELVHPMHRPWSSALALLASTVGDLPRYPRLLRLALSGYLTADSVRGVPATEPIVSCLLQAARGNDKVLALAGYLDFQGTGPGLLDGRLDDAGEWGADLLVALMSPQRAWQRVAAERHGPARLPALLALRAVCESSGHPDVQALLGQALTQSEARRILAAPLLRNRTLEVQSRVALLSADSSLTPHACAVRGPLEIHPLPISSAAAGTPVSAIGYLTESSVGSLLIEVSCDPVAWQVLETLWPSWEGSLVDLLAVSCSLAE